MAIYQFIKPRHHELIQDTLCDQFKKIIKRYKRVGYSMDIMQQSVCMAVNPKTVDSYGFLFNCTTVGHASDLMKALTLNFNLLVGA